MKIAMLSAVTLYILLNVNCVNKFEDSKIHCFTFYKKMFLKQLSYATLKEIISLKKKTLNNQRCSQFFSVAMESRKK